MSYATSLPLRSTETATNQDARQTNLRTVLQALSGQGPLSRADVARLTGLTRPTVSSLVAELLEDGLVTELGPGEASGGKPPTLVGVDPNGRALLCLDLSRRPFSGAVVDLSGDVRHRAEGPSGSPVGEDAVAAVHHLVTELRSRAHAPVAGIGIATPGLVTGDGRVIEASNLGWHELALARALEERHGLPVWLLNDADAAALTAFRHLPPDEESVAVIRIGEGIGAGFVLGGRPYVGARSAAGEIGHLHVVPDGASCACGGAGCLETVASVPAVRRGLVAAGGRGDDIAALLGSLDDTTALPVLEAAGRALGSVLAHLVAVLDVPRVELATAYGPAEERIVTLAAEETQRRLSPAVAGGVEILASAHGEEAVLRGASVLAVSQALGVVWR